METLTEGKNCILIVDDDFINRELLKNIFSSQYTFEEAVDGEEGLAQILRHQDKLCAIILDVQMPKMTGIELLGAINQHGVPDKVPTFLITAHDDDELVTTAYGLGVVDVVSKPITPIVIQKRVKTVIELFHARETLSATVKGQEQQISEHGRIMDELHRSTIESLAAAIEFRDMESGQHVSRIYGITKYILAYTPFGEGLSAEDIENIARGAIMHDVGKIAISDIILNKPGRLTKEEFEVMKTHTLKGEELLLQIAETQTHISYRYACEIARHHHERWDGRGYPDGLKGDQISIASQVVSIADVYDALVSERVYKKAFHPDEAVRMICNGECGCFNPKLLECFRLAEPEIRKWYTNEQDTVLTNLLNDGSGPLTATVQDPTPNTVLDIMLLTTAVQTAYDMIISVNLTKNTYYMIDYDRFQTHCADNGGVFDDLIEAGASSVPVSHRREFQDSFCRENLLKAFHAGKKSVRLEHPQYGDDGSLHWVSTKVLFMQDARSGDILQITLAQYIDEERAQKEQTRKILTDALNLAEQANNAKIDFLAKMSHDIRTPLNAIIGMTTIIAADMDNKEKISDCLTKIGTSSRYLLGLINDILDYSKIENGKLSLNTADFNLRDMLSGLASEVGARAKSKQHHFWVEIEDGVSASYVGDEYRIRQVLTNLLDNAYRYTPAEGSCSMKVSVSHHSGDYDVLCFTVTDSGAGIRPEHMEKIFEPFYQGDGTHAIESIGLGLPIARNLAHLMNGDLAVASQVGIGSVFTFELPLQRGSLTDYAETVEGNINVLVVDSDVTVCRQTAGLLQGMGIAARVAGSGADALQMVQQSMDTPQQVDVAIIEWNLPGEDGQQVIRSIRDKAGPGMLIAVMSADEWSQIDTAARAAGADLFLTKPVEESSLRTAIACSEKLLREKDGGVFHGEKILLAEDNEFNAEVAKTILEMKGLRVDVVPNGKVAYETFAASAPGEYMAILMDILMPVMDGHEAARAIRACEHVNAVTVPIYAMTANAFRSDILEAKLAGMNAHIAKPVDFEELSKMLHNVVKEYKNTQFRIGGGYHDGKL